MIDWGLGHYERTAAELWPVAEKVVSLAKVTRGEHVLDLATGTGNAVLLVAQSGTAATGIDASQRLIEVARQRAAQANVRASFKVADLQALPFDDDTFDVALSVFGLVFAADPEVAFAEMIRVLRPSGRALLSVWIPEGPIDRMVGVFAQALAAVTGSRPARFPWHDTTVISQLAASHDTTARFHDGKLTIVAESPEAYLAGNEQHPMSVAGRPVLEAAGILEATAERALAALREGNEDPTAFRTTSPYRVIEISRRPRHSDG